MTHAEEGRQAGHRSPALGAAAHESFQDLILALQQFWGEQGCVILQPYDMEVGAGTFHPATTLRALGPKPWNAAYVQPSRRPKDGRYGENPNRLQHYYQFQVIMKPSPADILGPLPGEPGRASASTRMSHDIRFVEDDWESPTLGAWGLGWEVWCDGMEVTQFTYFQQVGGFDCNPVSGEITYGLERLAMYVQGVDRVFDLNFNGRSDERKLTYGDVFLQAEQEYSRFNFEYADTEMLLRALPRRGEGVQGAAGGWQPARQGPERQRKRHKLALPAYDQCIKASHIFNLLDARGVISVTERQSYILRVRELAKACCGAWLATEGAWRVTLIAGIGRQRRCRSPICLLGRESRSWRAGDRGIGYRHVDDAVSDFGHIKLDAIGVRTLEAAWCRRSEDCRLRHAPEALTSLRTGHTFRERGRARGAARIVGSAEVRPMAELLLELFSEEIPARMQGRAAEDLRRLVTEGLKAQGLEAGEAKAFATPRRLTLVVEGVPAKSPDFSEERKGPRVECAGAGDRRVREVGGAEVDQGRAPSSRTRRRATSTSSRSRSPGARRRRSWPRWCRRWRRSSRGRSRCAGARAGPRGCGRCIRSCACSTARWCRSRSRTWRAARRRAGIASTATSRSR